MVEKTAMVDFKKISRILKIGFYTYGSRQRCVDGSLCCVAMVAIFFS
jgi:hypothetical protein